MNNTLWMYVFIFICFACKSTASSDVSIVKLQSELYEVKSQLVTLQELYCHPSFTLAHRPRKVLIFLAYIGLGALMGFVLSYLVHLLI